MLFCLEPYQEWFNVLENHTNDINAIYGLCWISSIALPDSLHPLCLTVPWEGIGSIDFLALWLLDRFTHSRAWAGDLEGKRRVRYAT